jgi:hypothetical protein
MAKYTNSANQFGPSQFVVDPSGNGSYTTIQSAVTAAIAAGAGNSVFVKPGTYNETVTVTGEVLIAALAGNGQGSVVNITGGVAVSSSSFAVADMTGLNVSNTGGGSAITLTGSGTAYFLATQCNFTNAAGPVVSCSSTGGGGNAWDSVFKSSSTGSVFSTTAGTSYQFYSCGIGTSGSVASVINASGSNMQFYNCQITDNITLTAGEMQYFNCTLQTVGSNAFAAIATSGTMKINSCVGGAYSSTYFINGNGVGTSGTLSYGAFVTKDSEASTSFDPNLTLQPLAVYPLATASASTSSGTRGSCAFSSASFAVDSAGFVTFIGSSGGLLPWTSISASQTLAVNNGYIVSSGALSLALPATSAVGAVIEINLPTSGTSWSITQASGQNITVNNLTSTTGTGGSVSSTATGQSIYLVCTVANTSWIAQSFVGNLTIV